MTANLHEVSEKEETYSR